MSARASCSVPSINPKSVSASVWAASACVGLRRDAMSSMTPIGSSLKTCLVAAGRRGDLVEQRSRRAAVGALVAVLRGQVGADERFESPPIRGLGVEALALGAQLVGEHVRDEIFLGREVGVEGAVGQAGVGHHGGHTGAVNAILFFEAPSSRFEDALSGGLLVVRAVAHVTPLAELLSIVSWGRVSVPLLHYDRTIVL